MMKKILAILLSLICFTTIVRADDTSKILQLGLTLQTTGDMIYSYDTKGDPTRLAIGSTGQVLTVVGGIPAWSTPSTTTATALTLPNNSFLLANSATSGTLNLLEADASDNTVLNAKTGKLINFQVNASTIANLSNLAFSANSTGVALGSLAANWGAGYFGNNTRVTKIGANATNGFVGTVSNHGFDLVTNNAAKWNIAAGGDLTPSTDATYKIGSASAEPLEYFVGDGTRKAFLLADTANTTVDFGTSSNNSLTFYTNNTAIWNFAASGDLLPNTDGGPKIGSASKEVLEMFVGNGTQKAYWFADSGNGNVQFGTTSSHSLAMVIGNGTKWTFGTDGSLTAAGSSVLDLTSSGAYTRTSSTNLSAAGSSISDCTALARTQNDVTTVGSGQGVCLVSSSATGRVIYVKNSGANDLKLYPDSSSAQINGAGNGNPITLTTANHQIATCWNRANLVWACTVSNAPNS